MEVMSQLKARLPVFPHYYFKGREREQNMKRLDLTGQKFERLTVVKWNKEKRQWLCKCDCGAETFASSTQLTKGRKKSCGCLNTEKARERAIERNKKMAKYCDYEVQEDYVIMYTPKGESFLVDLDIFYKIRFFNCSLDKEGYVICKTSRKNRFKLQRFIMGALDNEVVDHKNHDLTDNRRQNLRLTTSQKNSWNRKVAKNNTSGYTGVYWVKNNQKWRASIKVNRKVIILGLFADKQDAIIARRNAENEYFGDFSYLNSIGRNESGQNRCNNSDI